MNIAEIRATPLLCKFKQPYHWAQGVTLGAPVILIEVRTDEGITGIGESVASPAIEPVLAIINDAIPHFVGQSIYDGNRLIAAYYRSGFNARGTGSAVRYSLQAMAGIELSLWDAIGKAADQPLARILGGSVRDKVEYFGFVQGDKPVELAGHARALAKQGFSVLYVKIGRGEALDLDIVGSVRKAVGQTRLRLDANEVWDVMTARRMFQKLKQFDPEFIEQPLPGAEVPRPWLRCGPWSTFRSLRTRVHTHPKTSTTSAATTQPTSSYWDFTRPVGVVRFRKAAAIAEAAGVRICLHGVFETGITTCASNQVAATLNNLDDGVNQIMWQLLEEDLVQSPNLTPIDGALAVSDRPGLGFELNIDAVGRAAEAYRRFVSG